MFLRTEIQEATDLHTEALATVHHIETLEAERHTGTLAIAVHLTEALERPTEMARHTETLATADLHTEVPEAAMVHTEAQAEAHLTEVREAVHLTEAQEVHLTEVLVAAADEALAEAHEAEEAEDKPNAFKITILYKQTKHYNHEKVNCNSVFAHCGSCVGIGTKRV